MFIVWLKTKMKNRPKNTFQIKLQFSTIQLTNNDNVTENIVSNIPCTVSINVKM